MREALPDLTGPEPNSDDEPAVDAADRERPIRLAVVGRPNAGKSTLINRLLGEERLLTGPEAGITRDAIAVDLTWNGRPFRVHDTAGLRRQVQDRGEAGETLGRRTLSRRSASPRWWCC